MDPLANVNQAIVNVTALIAQVTASPQPTYNLDGESIPWESYLAMLIDKLEKLQEASIFLSGPYQLISQGVS